MAEVLVLGGRFGAQGVNEKSRRLGARRINDKTFSPGGDWVLTTTADAHPDGLPVPQRYWSILAIAVVMAMMVLDQSISNIALPTIARALHSSNATAIWVINAFQVSMIVFVLPLSALGEVVGYRRVFLAGMPVFACGALVCALSDSMAMLIVGRCIEGVGMACTSSCNSAVVRFTYPTALLGRGIGFNAMIIAIFSTLGPTIAGGILSIGPWQWLFALSIPLSFLGFSIGVWALPKTSGSGRSFDAVSAILNGLTWGGILLGGSTLAHSVSPLALCELAVGLVAGVFLALRELNKPIPLVPFDLMRIRAFRLSVLTAVVSFAAQMLAFVAIPFHFQGPLKIDVVTTGLLMTPWAIAAGVSANIGGFVSDRVAPGLLCAIGMLMLAVGLVTVSMISVGASNLDIIWRMTLCGAGFGFFQAPNNRAMVSAAPRERSGAAGGMLATSRVVGQTVGAGTMVLLFHAVPRHSTQAGLLGAAAIALAAAIVSATRVRDA